MAASNKSNNTNTVIESITLFVNTKSIERIKTFYAEAWRKYEEGEPMITDAEFDYFVDLVRKIHPNDCSFTFRTGIISGKDKIELPYLLPSLEEKKDDAAIGRWINAYRSNEYIVMAKLDGISAEWIPSKNKLFKRGNGIIGNDISRFHPYVNGLKKPLLERSLSEDDAPSRIEYAFRGEIMMRNDCRLVTDKSLPRNIIAGILNRKDSGLEDAREGYFVCYEIINPPNISPIKQLSIIEEMGFYTPKYIILNQNELKGEKLSEYFDYLRESDKIYDYDGVVVASDIARSENFSHEIKDGDVVLPKDKFKWKTPGQLVTFNTKVQYVEWNVQSDGKLVPVVWFDPVEVPGATIRKASAHNAEMIVKNKIGPGSVIAVHRANDTIPKIHKVIVPSEVPSMPTQSYSWNGVHIYQTEDTAEQRIAKLRKTLDALGVENVGPKVVESLYSSGFKTIKCIFDSSAKDFSINLPRFGDASADRLYQGLRYSRNKWDIVTFMIASQEFPSLVGKSKLNILMKENPMWKQWTYDNFSKNRPKGLSLDTIMMICNSINSFKKWYKEHRNVLLFDKNDDSDVSLDEYDDVDFRLLGTNNDDSLTRQSSVSGQASSTPIDVPPSSGSKRIIVPSGFRFNEELNRYLKPGDVVEENVTKNTTLVVYKSTFKKSAKTDKAEKYGIPVVDLASI